MRSGWGWGISPFWMVNPAHVCAVLIDIICVSLCFVFPLLLLLPWCSLCSSVHSLFPAPPHSYSLYFFTAVFCFSLLFLSSAQMQRRQLCCVLKCARLKPLRLASAVGKKIITNPHYRHSSLSLSYSLLPSLCLLILCNEMKNNWCPFREERVNRLRRSSSSKLTNNHQLLNCTSMYKRRMK